MADEHYASMMENLYWWGIPTLFRCPNEGPEGQDIALVGVPHSTGNGTTERDQHLGPRALRNVSAVGRRVHGGFGLNPWTAAKIADVGDVPFPRANDNRTLPVRRASFSAAMMPEIMDLPEHSLELSVQPPGDGDPRHKIVRSRAAATDT